MAKVSPDFKNILSVGAVAIVAVLVMAWASKWYRGMLDTGGRVPPPPETQG